MQEWWYMLFLQGQQIQFLPFQEEAIPPTKQEESTTKPKEAEPTAKEDAKTTTSQGSKQPPVDNCSIKEQKTIVKL